MPSFFPSFSCYQLPVSFPSHVYNLGCPRAVSHHCTNMQSLLYLSQHYNQSIIRGIDQRNPTATHLKEPINLHEPFSQFSSLWYKRLCVDMCRRPCVSAVSWSMMDLLKWQLVLWFMVIYRWNNTGADPSYKLPPVLMMLVKPHIEMTALSSEENSHAYEDLNVKCLLSKALNFGHVVLLAALANSLFHTPPWINAVVAFCEADRVGWERGTACPPYLMTCRVYHVEQRHGHLTSGLVVTASKSLESTIGNQ